MLSAQRRKENTEFCERYLNSWDPERYLCATRAWPKKRTALVGLTAFDCELLRIHREVKDRNSGQQKLQRWRDAIEQIANGKLGAPNSILELVAYSVDRFGVALQDLHRLIDAREPDLAFEAPATLDDLESYSRNTDGTLMKLWGRVGGNDHDLDEIAESIGIAWSIAKLVRLGPDIIPKHRRYIPDEALDAANYSLDDYERMAPLPESKEIFRITASRAEAHLERAKAVKVPFSPLSCMRNLAELELKYLKRYDYDVFGYEVFAARPNRSRIAWRVLLT